MGRVLAASLLLASIAAMDSTYGVQPASPIDAKAELRELLKYASR